MHLLGTILFQTPVPPTLDVAGAVDTLTTLGVIPVITLAAVVGVATMLYKRFRK